MRARYRACVRVYTCTCIYILNNLIVYDRRIRFFFFFLQYNAISVLLNTVLEFGTLVETTRRAISSYFRSSSFGRSFARVSITLDSSPPFYFFPSRLSLLNFSRSGPGSRFPPYPSFFFGSRFIEPIERRENKRFVFFDLDSRTRTR